MTTLLVACGDGETELVGYEVSPAPEVGSFALTDVTHGGEAFALSAPRGDFLVVFLGFTNCPDACPAAMGEIEVARARLGDAAERVQVAMISVDPDRDNGADFVNYVTQFADDGRALRTDDPAELQKVVTAFGATSMVDNDDSGAPQVGHTDYTYLVDDQGAVVLTWTADMSADDIANDLELFLGR
jgi:protein SCO1/2